MALEGNSLKQHQQSRASSLGTAAQSLPPQPQSARAPEAAARFGAQFMDIRLPARSEPSPSKQAAKQAANMAPTLGQAMAGRTKAPEQAEQGDDQVGKGKQSAGRERPTEPSFYTAFSQTTVLPKRDEQSQKIQQARRSVDRSRGRSI
jgi:hypothetical protein